MMKKSNNTYNTYNPYWIIDEAIIFKPNLNYSLDNYTKIISKYSTLDCNSQTIIDNLPFGIEELVFGYKFNLELNNLPNSIKKISIYNGHYNKKLNNLPKSIEYLETSFSYKVPIDAKYKNLNIVKFFYN